MVGENGTEQLSKKSTPASPLAEWAVLKSCYSVVHHESQSADVCSVPQLNLHTPTINPLPGNPLHLTCVCVFLSVVYVLLTSTLSQSESKRES